MFYSPPPTPAEEAEPAKEPGERPSKRRCFWEYRRSRETAVKKKLGGDVRWSLSWSSSTLPSTLYRREGEASDWLRAVLGYNTPAARQEVAANQKRVKG